MNDWVQVVGTAGDVALLLATPAVVAFTIRYGVWSRWRSTSAGRSVFWLAVSLSMLVVLVFWAALDRLTGWDTGNVRIWFRFLAYAMVAVASWRLVYTLSRYQISEARQRQEAEGRRKLTEDQQRGPLGS